MAGTLSLTISYPSQNSNDAIPVSDHPMEMAGSSPVMTGLDRCAGYVNSKVVDIRLARHRNQAGMICLSSTMNVLMRPMNSAPSSVSRFISGEAAARVSAA
jgi:hypothetical protein